MLPKYFVLLSQYLIFHIQYGFLNAKPLSGNDVRNAAFEEFPFIATIMHVYYENAKLKTEFECSGAIITENMILSAAHCVEDKTITNIKIIIGSTDLNNTVQYNASWWIIYDEWVDLMELDKAVQGNDLTIIQICPDIPNIIPAKFSNLSYSELFGLRLTLIGWHLPNNNQTSAIMVTSLVDVVDNNLCKTKSTNYAENTFQQRFFCTVSNSNVLLDYGDSGGPVLYDNKIVGINVGTCSEFENNSEKVNLHIGIDYYRDFILEFCPGT